MNYKDPELLERLSSEYVLGTLRGKARDRFERLMLESHTIRSAVWSWEAQLNPLGTFAPEVEAPKHIWPAIQRRLGHKPAAAQGTQSGGWFDFWKGWSMLATAATLVLAVMLVLNLQTPVAPPAQPGPDHVALFAEGEAQPQWLVSFDLNSGRLKAKALNVEAVEAGRAFELWVLPGAGAAPRSLGLLPVADQTIDNPLATPLIDVLRNADGLAVSLEPAGGSPTGLPTGPVLYQSRLLEL